MNVEIGLAEREHITQGRQQHYSLLINQNRKLSPASPLGFLIWTACGLLLQPLDIHSSLGAQGTLYSTNRGIIIRENVLLLFCTNKGAETPLRNQQCIFFFH